MRLAEEDLAPLIVQVASSGSRFSRNVDIAPWLNVATQADIDTLVSSCWSSAAVSSRMCMALHLRRDSNIIALYAHVNMIASGDETDNVGLVASLRDHSEDITAWLKRHREDLLICRDVAALA